MHKVRGTRRFNAAAACSLVALALAPACSDDEASEGENGASGGASAAGSAGAGGAGGSSTAGAGGGGDANYSVAEACQLFAQENCARGEGCGLVLGVTEVGLICLQCTQVAVQSIAAACERDLAGPKPAREVDACLANVASAPCDVICGDDALDSCGVFAELEGGGGGGGAAGLDAGSGGEDSVLCTELCLADAGG